MKAHDPVDDIVGRPMRQDTHEAPAANPLRATGPLTDYAAIRPGHVGPAVEFGIAAHREAIAACRVATGFDAVFAAREQADAELAEIWGAVTHLGAVADTPALRAARAAAEPVMVAYLAEAGQDAVLNAAIAAIPRDGLTARQCRALDHAMRAFRRSGGLLDDEARARFAAIQVELGRSSTAFADAVLDATASWTIPLADEAALDGLPDTDRAMLAANARREDLDGWLVDLHQPSMRAVTARAHDRDLRRRVYEAYATRASDMGPDAGQFDNGDRIGRILALRREAAALLGFADPAAWYLEPRMADDADTVDAFLRDLAERARPRALAELAELRQVAREHGMETLEPWDVAYVSDLIRRERFAVDDAEIRRHLPLDRVWGQLMALIGTLFGVTMRAVDGVSTWHPDVVHYKLERGGAVVGRLYCDFHARAGKRAGAWMMPARAALPGRIPVAHLILNAAPPPPGDVTRLSHGDMVTLFHEMGHCLHHLLAECDLPSIAGTAGIEWDAVELPSQFLERFAWEADILLASSAHPDTGAPLPEETIATMAGTRRAFGGLALLRQVEFALFDLQLHRARTRVDVNALLASVRADVAVMRSPEWDRAASTFSHVFAGDYAAGYYGYLWGERLSADAFEAFAAPEDRAGQGDAFRRTILAATRPMRERFRAFRGRDADTGALLRAWGLDDDTPRETAAPTRMPLMNTDTERTTRLASLHENLTLILKDLDAIGEEMAALYVVSAIDALAGAGGPRADDCSDGDG